MIFIYSIIAIFIAWVWVDYYRMLDIYKPDKFIYLAAVFLMGCASVFVVYGFHYVVPDSWLRGLNGNFINDFLYSSLQVGLLEELAKLVPFLIALRIFKKQFDEPVDFLAYMCCSALGFSAVENIMYFNNYGASIIDGRAILSTVGHMFDSSLVAYGFILHRFHPRKPKFWPTFLSFLGLGALAHGIYDFILFYVGGVPGYLLVIVYFLFTVSIFAVILNNSLNNSPYFSYKKVVNSHSVLNQLISAYVIIFAAQFILVSADEGLLNAFRQLHFTTLSTGFIIATTSARLSRFKLIEKRWNPIKLELPFSTSYVVGYGAKARSVSGIKIKGEAYNEAYLHHFYEKEFYLKPQSMRNTKIGGKRLAFMERKNYLKNDESFFLVKVFHGAQVSENFDYFLLKPKTRGRGFSKKGAPIVALLRMNTLEDFDEPSKGMSDFSFVEWCFVKSLNKEQA